MQTSDYHHTNHADEQRASQPGATGQEITTGGMQLNPSAQYINDARKKTKEEALELEGGINLLVLSRIGILISLGVRGRGLRGNILPNRLALLQQPAASGELDSGPGE